MLNKKECKSHFANLFSNVVVNDVDVYKTTEVNKVKRDTTKSFWNAHLLLR